MQRTFFSLDPIDSSLAQARNDRARWRLALFSALVILTGVWLLWLLTLLLGWSLDDLGVRPRQAMGLIGIVTAPLAHGSFAHLMSNTLPLMALLSLTLYSYPLATRFALPIIWLGAGLGVWLFARPSIHLGISGIIHGLMFFLFLMGLLRRDRMAVTISLAVFFLYGGMVLSVLPGEPQISWEYHGFGALFGVLAAMLLRKLDPLPVPKQYSWDLEPEMDYSQDEHTQSAAGDANANANGRENPFTFPR